MLVLLDINQLDQQSIDNIFLKILVPWILTSMYFTTQQKKHQFPINSDLSAACYFKGTGKYSQIAQAVCIISITWEFMLNIVTGDMCFPLHNMIWDKSYLSI